ncbi:NAD(P)-dependent alcohol dehydrogenase [Polymorphobacter arshaanensis]|uniref:NAD(P)-dependent alcohol dehydrogenase n=1 Tax=Glacieibacterium arshaanense TaxID=2511025 RepID=A0A4Y9EQQ1_9SPHN|nr:NAD(P)-dependent alcohol dehydrogenase [Polymorphobacter arshaanensis]TFU03679.1 NAD(P)-dependent alcohol dehydrogenase [Polymorphobacter arshaanensis]
MTDITAAVLRESFKPWTVEKAKLEAPRADEVLVRIVATGICHSDMTVRDQYLPTPLPAVLGHEGAGVVEAVGADVTHVAVGDHVVLAPAYCGECRHCASGQPMRCVQFGLLNLMAMRADGSSPICGCDGERVGGMFFGQSSFATHSVANKRSVVKIPNDVPLALMGPLGCGLMTGSGTVLNALKPGPGSSFVVFGAGAVGLAALMAAVASGCTTVIAVDLHDNRLKLAKELGATHVVNAGAGNPVEAVRAILPDGVDFAVDTSALPPVIRQAVECLGTGGRCAFIGVSKAGAEITVPVNALINKSMGYVVEGDAVPHLFIPKLITLWRQGKFPFEKLVRYYPLADINRAVADSESGATLKPILVIDPESPLLK